MESWTIKEWGIIASLLISFTTLGLVIYKDFIQGSILKTVLNSIVFIKLAEVNKVDILIEIIVDDILSGRPSEQAVDIISASAEIHNALKNRNRQQTKSALINYTMELNRKKLPQIVYNPNHESIVRYFGNKNFIISFYTPINIINVGRKTGDITTIILQLTSINDPLKKWIFSCFTEIKPEEILNSNNFDKPTGHFLGKLFPGISIGPNNNQRLDLFLIPLDTNKDRIISSSGIIPGKYKIQLFGYNSLNKKCLESNLSLVNVNQAALIDLFNGSNIVQNLTMEDHIEKLLN
jgi:hypothetical protein